MKYTLDQAEKIAVRLETVLAPLGYHVALTGSVLYRGGSVDDIDFLVYKNNPRTGPKDYLPEVAVALAKVWDACEYRIKETDDYRNRKVLKGSIGNVPVDLLEVG